MGARARNLRKRVVSVEWRDACGIDTKWLSLKKARKPFGGISRSFGVLVRKDRKFTILAQNITDNDEEEKHRLYSTFIEIPSSLVRKIKTLEWIDPKGKKRKKK